MAEDRWITNRANDWKDALILTAFPTTGSAASIATHFLREELKLELAASIHIKGQGPIVVVQSGIATAPVRVFGGDATCDIKLQKRCRDLYIVTTDLVLDPAMMRRVAHLILEKAKADGAHMILALEGVVRGEGDDTPDLFMAAASPEVLEELQVLEVPTAGQALIGGMTGELLLEASGNGVPVGSLMVQASRRHPDGRAAAALIKVLDKLIPQVKIDPGPLEEQAMKLEKAIKQAQEEAQRSQDPMPTHSTFI